MDQKLFRVSSVHSEFYADLNEKYFFSKFSIFRVIIPLLNFEFNFAISRKLRRQKMSKFRFLGQFLTLKNMVIKFFRNSNFSDFLGIKSEISHCSPYVILIVNIPEKFRETSKIRPIIRVFPRVWLIIGLISPCKKFQFFIFFSIFLGFKLSISHSLGEI